MAAPNVVALLDDGSGTYPYDISRYVRMTPGVTIVRGRTDEFSTIAPGTCAFDLDNSDGRFTPLSANYNIDLGVMIRVGFNIGGSIVNGVAVGGTTYWRFTGELTSLPGSWPTGFALFSVISLGATDLIGRMQRAKMRSVLEQTILALNPVGYWTFGDAVGATTAAETSGGTTFGALSPVAMYGMISPSVIFGKTQQLATTKVTACTISGTAGTPLVNLVGPQPPLIAPSGHGVSMVLTISGMTAGSPIVSGTSTGYSFSCGSVTIQLEPSGGHPYTRFIVQDAPGANTATSALITDNIDDGGLHQLVLTYDPTTGQGVAYIDGAWWGQIGGGGGPNPTPTIGATSNPGAFSINPGGAPTIRAFDACTIGHAAVFNTSLSAQNVADMWSAATTGFTGDLLSARVPRTVSYVQQGIATNVDLSAGTALGFTPIDGLYAWDVIQSAVAAEMGIAFMDGQGRIATHQRTWSQLRISPDVIIDTESDMVDPGTTQPYDLQNLCNSATSQRAAPMVTGATAGVPVAVPTIVNTDPVSLGKRGEFPQSYTWLVQTDAEAAYRGQWIVAKHGNPKPRMPQLAIEILTQSATVQAQMMLLELGMHVRTTTLPNQAATGATSDTILAGYTETLSGESWKLTLNVFGFTDQSALILDDGLGTYAPYNRLDSAVAVLAV